MICSLLLHFSTTGHLPCRRWSCRSVFGRWCDPWHGRRQSFGSWCTSCLRRTTFSVGSRTQVGWLLLISSQRCIAVAHFHSSSIKYPLSRLILTYHPNLFPFFPFRRSFSFSSPTHSLTYPPIFSGEEGVYNVLKLLNDELVLAMKLAGCVNLTDLKPAMIRTALSFQSRL
jgi:hypothetical protein